MKKAGDDVAMAILGMGPKPSVADGDGMDMEDNGDEALEMASEEMMAAIKKNDGKAFAEALRAAIAACKYEE